MAAPPSASYAAASSCARLPSAACARASRAAAAFFPSRRTRLKPSISLLPIESILHPLVSLHAARPAALAARAGAGPLRNLAAAAAASQKKLMGSLTNAEGLRFGVVVARFNEVVTNLLLQGALETFERYSVRAEDITVVSVPGSFEVPITAQKLGKSRKFDAILCIGAVIRGDTTHYDAVANSAASGVLNAGLSAGIPCVFGVLTCEDMDQALNRAGGKAGNKGAEAAITAIEMASLFRHHLC